MFDNYPHKNRATVNKTDGYKTQQDRLKNNRMRKQAQQQQQEESTTQQAQHTKNNSNKTS